MKLAKLIYIKNIYIDIFMQQIWKRHKMINIVNRELFIFLNTKYFE